MKYWKSRKYYYFVHALCILLIVVIGLNGYSIAMNMKLEVMKSKVNENLVMNVAKKISSECKNLPEPMLRKCKINRAFSYSSVFAMMITPTNSSFSEEFFSKYSLDSAIVNMSGNCKHIALYTTSLLKALDINNTYLIAQPEHVCVGVYESDEIKTFNCLNDKILFIKAV